MKMTIAVLTALLATAVHAETCKYVDAQGHVTYSNVPVAGANKVGCLPSPGPVPHSAPQRIEEKKPESAARSPQDSARAELQARLAAEEARLAEAKRQLAEQEAIRTGDERNYQRVLDRLKPYQDNVAQLQKSVEALQQELSATR